LGRLTGAAAKKRVQTLVTIIMVPTCGKPAYSLEDRKVDHRADCGPKCDNQQATSNEHVLIHASHLERVVQ
jgi:hypothetical protein